MISLTDFYNHDSFMQEVKEGEKLINNISSGTQEFIYNIGDIISFNGVERATIKDRYKQNGYCYYECIWTTGKRKKVEHFSRERQQDIILLEEV